MADPDIQEMVERISWFSPVDYEILSFFDTHDIWASAQVVAKNIGYNRRYVNGRLNELEKQGLFHSEKGIYELTDFGRRFLAGEVDESELSDLEGDG